MKALPKTQNRANLSSDKKDGKTGGLMKKLFNSSPKTDEDQEGNKDTNSFNSGNTNERPGKYNARTSSDAPDNLGNFQHHNRIANAERWNDTKNHNSSTETLGDIAKFYRNMNNSSDAVLLDDGLSIDDSFGDVPNQNRRKEINGATQHLRRHSDSSISSNESLSMALGLDDKLGLDSVTSNQVKKSFSASNIKGEDEGVLRYMVSRSLETPKYIKIHRKDKNNCRELNHLFLAQELDGSSETEDPLRNEISSLINSNGVSFDFIDLNLRNNERPRNAHRSLSHPASRSHEVYILEFSKDGRYLAAGGRDGLIRIWEVISSPLSRLKLDSDFSSQFSTSRRIYRAAPVFHNKPVRIFQAHSKAIMALDWSKNNFLISGSVDKTIKIWHVDKPSSLSTFESLDIVTSLKFYPTDDRFFVSGSLDNEVKFWSILEGKTAFSRNLEEDMLITTISLTPDGKYCIVGGFNGTVVALKTKGLTLEKRFKVKPNKSLKSPLHLDNIKITGIKVFESPGDLVYDAEGDISLDNWGLLVTTNASTISLVNSKARSVTRLKGFSNGNSSISASIADDRKHVITGSENHCCYIWENNSARDSHVLVNKQGKNKLNGKSNTNGIRRLFSKLNSSRLKKFDEDVKGALDSHTTSLVTRMNNSYACFHAQHSRVNCAIIAPENTTKLLELSDDVIYTLLREGKRMNLLEDEENKKTHEFGVIIVTTDEFGLIRVFRVDTAYKVRLNLVNLLNSKKSS